MIAFVIDVRIVTFIVVAFSLLHLPWKMHEYAWTCVELGMSSSSSSSSWIASVQQSFLNSSQYFLLMRRALRTSSFFGNQLPRAPTIKPKTLAFLPWALKCSTRGWYFKHFRSAAIWRASASFSNGQATSITRNTCTQQPLARPYAICACRMKRQLN